MIDDTLIAELRAALSYDPATGIIRRTTGWKAGLPAGSVDGKGHRQIKFRGRLYLAHRIAWVISYGRWPDGELDHINRVRSDNRLANLRECTHAENSRNRSRYSSNSSGVNGVSWYPRYQKWLAYIRVEGKHKSLGYFANRDDAAAARLEAEKRYYGEFRGQAA